ncbi:DNA repair protein RecN (Recombination protein N) [Salinibacillus kushneri]|uniref:DNA repair protein RecN n=1 Tax=Salinibacillus kushneri TaxID=237682 RepID=A0A1I0FQP1_9BACI|nr:DNA repair protein RecN [Salinibacillus kushneri]SET60775.1 DNA repair protein RecN (Recombination protein N) [Salinibacillus kushneri]
MLAELSIKDFAIIDEIKIDFREGLTVLTGETGAGKSIIIDAIQLLAGGRGSVEFVRHGAKKTEIEGLFFLDSKHHLAYEKANEFGVEMDEEGMLVLNRTITSSGKSICRVNGKLVTLAILREFGQTLIDIHSQHETQSLMDTEKHLALLDLYGREEIMHAKKEYKEIYGEYKQLEKRYRELSENEQEIAQRLDLLKFQQQELEEAELTIDEDVKLEQERKTLQNYEKIYQNISDAYYALYGEQKALDWLALTMTSLETIKEFDEDLGQKANDISNHYYMIEELSFELRNKLEEMEFDPERLNEIETRLNDINRLKRKYGSSVSEMLDYAAKIDEEIEQLDNKDVHLSKLEQSLKSKGRDVILAGEQLHELRKKAAQKLKKAILSELKDLYLEKADFDVYFTVQEGNADDPEWKGQKVRLHENGLDKVQFLISTNVGEPLKEVHKIASGGELSRIMLAIKKNFARHQGVTSVIFDEVDTGVSGRVAQAIAEKIYSISNSSQVLCISHLPQVASMADIHLLIEKDVRQERTITKVNELGYSEKINEIGRMISGTELTDTTKEHAEELISQASELK